MFSSESKRHTLITTESSFLPLRSFKQGLVYVRFTLRRNPFPLGLFRYWWPSFPFWNINMRGDWVQICLPYSLARWRASMAPSVAILLSLLTVIVRLAHTPESLGEVWKLRALGAIPTASERVAPRGRLSSCLSTRWYSCHRLRGHPLGNVWVGVCVCSFLVVLERGPGSCKTSCRTCRSREDGRRVASCSLQRSLLPTEVPEWLLTEEVLGRGGPLVFLHSISDNSSVCPYLTTVMTLTSPGLLHFSSLDPLCLCPTSSHPKSPYLAQIPDLWLSCLLPVAPSEPRVQDRWTL